MTLYLRPVHLVDSPIGLTDGSWRRLGNSLLWVQGVGVRGAGALEIIPVAALDDWLAALPDPLRAQADAQLAGLGAPRPPMVLGDRTIRFDTPQVMGILNMTPD